MNVGTATITINPVNDAPVLVTTSVTESVNEEESIDITITATDVDGDQLTFQWDTGDENNDNPVVTDGTISINGNVYTYTLGSDIELSEDQTYGDSFYYYANDNSGEKTAYGFATITTVGVDDLPHAEDKYVATPENSSIDILLSSIDPDGGDNSNIQYEITSSPTNGSVVLNDALATYTPNTDYHGDDTFQYKVTGDNIIATVTIGINEIVGTVKLYPDLISGYDESFSGILFDESTNGYVVTGLHREQGDNGGTTYGVISLATDSNLSTTLYQQVSNFDLNGTAFPDPATSDRWGFKIGSRNSIDGNYALLRSDRLTFISSSTGLVENFISMQQDWTVSDPYGSFDHPGKMIQTSNGYILHTEITGRDNPSNCGVDRETYPAAVKMDLQGNMEYYLPIDYDADESRYYNSRLTGGIAQGESSDIFYMIAETGRCGFDDEIRLFKVQDTGTSFSLINSYKLSDVSGSPSKLNTESIHQNIVVHEATSSLFKFSILTGNSNFKIATYKIQNPDDSNATINVSLTNEYITNGTAIEIVGEADNLYVAFHGRSDNNQRTDIVIGKFDSSSSLIWSKQADIQGSGSVDIFGGITLNDDGVAVTGYTKAYNVGNTPGDRNGFILLLDSNGD